MFPLNDVEPNRYSFFPFMTVGLIIANVIVFFLDIYFQTVEEYWNFLMVYAFTPNIMWASQGGGVISALTSQFLHGDIFHIGGNMLFLWVFGRRIEDAFGSWRFLLYYLLAGFMGHLVTALFLPAQSIPSLGASGAVSGLIGAYLILFPGGRIRTLILLGVVPLFIKVRGFWIAGFYLLTQIGPALEIVFTGVHQGVGYWAHLGGFAACLFCLLFLRPEAFARYMSEVPV